MMTAISAVIETGRIEPMIAMALTSRGIPRRSNVKMVDVTMVEKMGSLLVTRTEIETAKEIVIATKIVTEAETEVETGIGKMSETVKAMNLENEGERRTTQTGALTWIERNAPKVRAPAATTVTGGIKRRIGSGIGKGPLAGTMTEILGRKRDGNRTPTVIVIVIAPETIKDPLLEETAIERKTLSKSRRTAMKDLLLEVDPTGGTAATIEAEEGTMTSQRAVVTTVTERGAMVRNHHDRTRVMINDEIRIENALAKMILTQRLLERKGPPTRKKESLSNTGHQEIMTEMAMARIKDSRAETQIARSDGTAASEV